MSKDNLLDKKIGILGGGQLGKMLCQAASKWHLDMHVLDQSKSFPAGYVCGSFTEGNFKNFDDVLHFGKSKDVVTIEIEAVNTEALSKLQHQGKMVYPTPESIDIIKDKGIQKQFYQKNDIPTSAFKLYPSHVEIQQDIQENKLTLPFVQKLRKDGYDGRGVQLIRSTEDLKELFEQPSLVEELVDIEKEIAVIAARNRSGATCVYDCVEMVFHPSANLLDYQIAPAQISEKEQNIAQSIAKLIVDKMSFVGLLAVEMFLTRSGTIIVNEIAPRPHNSGHHTIEACISSQYEQHLRAILDMPLGDTSLLKPAAMINILGSMDGTGQAVYLGMDKLMQKSGIYIHLYGKEISKPNRKMGHITILADDISQLKEKVTYVKSNFKVGIA